MYLLHSVNVYIFNVVIEIKLYSIIFGDGFVNGVVLRYGKYMIAQHNIEGNLHKQRNIR